MKGKRKYFQETEEEKVECKVRYMSWEILRYLEILKNLLCLLVFRNFEISGFRLLVNPEFIRRWGVKLS